MLEDLLERAEEQTRIGDRTKATALLRAAVDGATADLQRKPTERTRAVRAGGSVPARDAAAAGLDNSQGGRRACVAPRLPAAARGRGAALRRHIAPAAAARPRTHPASSTKRSACKFEKPGGDLRARRDLLASARGLRRLLQRNVPLDDEGPLGGFKRRCGRPLMSRARRRARSGPIQEKPTARTNCTTTSDEAALRSTGETRSPIASSVFYLETIDNDGAPTLVMERRLGDSERTRAGWLCAPRPNRLPTFDGSLLHCVVPPLPAPADAARRRITVMVGWWGPDVTVGDPARPSPNRPLGTQAWLPSVSFEDAPTVEVTAPHAVARAWRRVKGSVRAFGDLVVACPPRGPLLPPRASVRDRRECWEAAPKPAAVEFVDLASLVAACRRRRRRSGGGNAFQLMFTPLASQCLVFVSVGACRAPCSVKPTATRPSHAIAPRSDYQCWINWRVVMVKPTDVRDHNQGEHMTDANIPVAEQRPPGRAAFGFHRRQRHQVANCKTLASHLNESYVSEHGHQAAGCPVECFDH